jgi:hypothetical protein
MKYDFPLPSDARARMKMLCDLQYEIRRIRRRIHVERRAFDKRAGSESTSLD